MGTRPSQRTFVPPSSRHATRPPLGLPVAPDQVNMTLLVAGFPQSHRENKDGLKHNPLATHLLVAKVSQKVVKGRLSHAFRSEMLFEKGHKTAKRCEFAPLVQDFGTVHDILTQFLPPR